MNILQRAITFYLNKVPNQFVRFVLVGGLNTAFGVGIYCLAIWVGLPYYAATLVSQILGTLWNFMTTGRLVFENHDKRLIFRFVANYIVMYFFNIGIIKLLLIAGLNDYWAGIGATPIVAICSFISLKYLVYKK